MVAGNDAGPRPVARDALRRAVDEEHALQRERLGRAANAQRHEVAVADA